MKINIIFSPNFQTGLASTALYSECDKPHRIKFTVRTFKYVMFKVSHFVNTFLN